MTESRYADQTEAEGIGIGELQELTDRSMALLAIEEIANDPSASGADIAQVVFDQLERLNALADVAPAGDANPSAGGTHPGSN